MGLFLLDVTNCVYVKSEKYFLPSHSCVIKVTACLQVKVIPNLRGQNSKTWRLLFFGHRSFIRKITHKAVINIAKQCISNNLT